MLYFSGHVSDLSPTERKLYSPEASSDKVNELNLSPLDLSLKGKDEIIVDDDGDGPEEKCADKEDKSWTDSETRPASESTSCSEAPGLRAEPAKVGKKIHCLHIFESLAEPAFAKFNFTKLFW